MPAQMPPVLGTTVWTTGSSSYLLGDCANSNLQFNLVVRSSIGAAHLPAGNFSTNPSLGRRQPYRARRVRPQAGCGDLPAPFATASSYARASAPPAARLANAR